MLRKAKSSELQLQEVQLKILEVKVKVEVPDDDVPHWLAYAHATYTSKYTQTPLTKLMVHEQNSQ